MMQLVLVKLYLPERKKENVIYDTFLITEYNNIYLLIADVYICGGHDGTTIFSDIWTINLKQLQWKKLSVEMPLPLYFHSVAMSEVCKISFSIMKVIL